MSSMRNAVQRRNHKERAQPKEREKWGILEKHKDYSLRAKDYNEKKARLKILRQKAAERNPDEFYYGMYSGKTHDKGQKLTNRGNKVLSQDAVKLLKTQDAGYLRTMAQQTRRAREKLGKAYVLTDGEGVEVCRDESRAQGEHIVFVGSKEEQRDFGTDSERLKSVHKAEASQTELDEVFLSSASYSEATEGEEADDLKPIAQKSRKGIEAEATALRQIRILRKQRKREREARLSRLKALEAREKNLLAAQEELALQRAKMTNSVGGVNKAGVKFKIRERKR